MFMKQTRNVDMKIVNELKKGRLHFLLDYQKEKDFFIGVRDNALSIYINCGEIITFKLKNNEINYEINDRDYLRFNGKGKREKLNDNELIFLEEYAKGIGFKGKLNDESINYVKGFIETIYPYVRKYNEGTEKEIQQNILIENNKLNKNVIVLDTEVNFKGVNNSETGRVDVLAYDFVKHIIYLIEVKRGTNAYGKGTISDNNRFGSGIVGHFYKYAKIIKEMREPIIFHTNATINFNNEVYACGYGAVSDDVDIQMVLYLYDGTEKSFQNHLGVSKSKNAELNVKETMNDEEYKKYVTPDFEYNLLFVANNSKNKYDLTKLLPNIFKILEVR